MTVAVTIDSTTIAREGSTYICAEIGINHNGDIALAKKMIDVAASAGCNAVKFQKRTPELCVPKDFRNVMRDTPWGIMTYLEYRERIELNKDEYVELFKYAKSRNLSFFASVWDIPSIGFCVDLEMPALKIPSAMMTNRDLVLACIESGLPLIISTGMSTEEEIDTATRDLNPQRTILCHTVSTYPANATELNLRMISTFLTKYPFVIGYSGHETGLSPSVAAHVLGARFIERHITTDRALWGSDQAASLEPEGLRRLVRDIRVIESAMGTGKRELLPSELDARKRLRGT